VDCKTHHHLTRYGVELLGDVGQHGATYLNEKCIMELALAQWRCDLGAVALGATEGMAPSVVRAQPDINRLGFRTLTYITWFQTENTPRDRFWFHLLLPTHIQMVARFRLGSHGLRNLEHGMARSQRVCQCCTDAVCEDEAHMLFECSAYNVLRVQHRELFELFQATVPTTPGSLDHIMKLSVNPKLGASEAEGRMFWRSLVAFLLDCTAERTRILASQGEV
jgi:hypothetical protein